MERSIVQRLPAAPAGCLALLACVLAAAALPAPAAGAIKLGVFNSGAPKDAGTVAAYTELVGRQPDIVMWYHDFGHDILTSEEIATLRDTGQAPMVTWEPFEQSLDSIAAGGHDAYLRESARTAREYGGELMIRFAHEMNGSWYPWGRSASYVSAWRHIVSLFRAEGAANVRWVWAPNVDRNGRMPFAGYFPGEGWVDYIGLDGYNWGGERWHSLESVFAASYDRITALSAKPLIITETGSSETGGDKAEWIRTGFMDTVPRRFPRVSAVVWFNKKQEDDWPIVSSRAALDAYRDVVACSLYGGPSSCGAGAASGDGPSSAATQDPPPRIYAVRATPNVLVPPRRLRAGVRSERWRRTARARRRAARRHGARIGGVLRYILGPRADRVRIAVHRRARRGFVRRAVVEGRKRPGANRVGLLRLLPPRGLRRGRYLAVIVAFDGEGNRSRPRRAAFRLVG